MVDEISTVAAVARVVASYVANNRVPPDELVPLILAVHQAVIQLTTTVIASSSEHPLKPAVPIRRSVTNEFIVCLEDGLRFKSLKRHLRSAYGMTPEQYRLRWNLAYDYPMVAPAYAAHRSQLAKKIGLGRKRSRRR